MTIATLLLLIAIVLFVAAAFGVSTRRVSLTDLGLAFLAGSFLVAGGSILL